jgi:hypothetical protein
MVRRLRQELKRKAAREEIAVCSARQEGVAAGRARIVRQVLDATNGAIPCDADSDEMIAWIKNLDGVGTQASMLAQIDALRNQLFDKTQAALVERLRREQVEEKCAALEAEHEVHVHDYQVLESKLARVDLEPPPHQAAGGASVNTQQVRQTMETNTGRGSRSWYKTEMIEDMQTLIQRHSLTGRVAPLLHSALGFWIRQPIDWCVKNFPLPRDTQQRVHTRMVGALALEGHLARLQNALLYSLSADEATISRIKTFCVLATFTLLAEGQSGLPHTEIHNVERLSSTSADNELVALMACMGSEGVELARWLWFNSDSAASNLKAHQLGREMKVKRGGELCADPESGWSYPIWMPEDVRERFLVHEEQPYDLIPVELIFSPDLMHIAKNGEKTGLKRIGGSVRLGVPERLVSCVQTAALFSFSRLFANSHEVRNVAKVVAHDVGRKFSTIPGEVNHRLKIIGGIARAVHSSFLSLLEVCSMYKTAYTSGTRPDGTWKLNKDGVSRKALIEHVEEVSADLGDPRCQAFNAVYARVQVWQEAFYGEFQTDGGYNWFTARRRLLGFFEDLADMRDHFEDYFDIAFIVAVWEEAGDNGVIVQMRDAHQKAVRAEAESKANKRSRKRKNPPSAEADTAAVAPAARGDGEATMEAADGDAGEEGVAAGGAAFSVAATAAVAAVGAVAAPAERLSASHLDDSFGEAHPDQVTLILDDGEAVTFARNLEEVRASLADAIATPAAGGGVEAAAAAAAATAATPARAHPFEPAVPIDGGNVNRLLMADDMEQPDVFARAQILDCQAVLDGTLTYMWEKSEATLAGADAYPALFAALYDPAGDPWFVVSELHRFKVWCNPDGCLFCNPLRRREVGWANVPQLGRAEYLESRASAFGLYDHPKCQAELIEVAKQVYAGTRPIVLSNDAAVLELGPLQRCNGMTIGPNTDRLVSTMMCGKYETMDVERMFKPHVLGRMMTDTVTKETVMMKLSKAAIELDEGFRRDWNSKFYAATRSVQAVQDRRQTTRAKLDKEGFWQQLLDKGMVAEAKRDRDKRVAMERAQRKVEKAMAKAVAQAAREARIHQTKADKELLSEAKKAESAQKVKRREALQGVAKKTLESVLTNAASDATGSITQLRTRLVNDRALWENTGEGEAAQLVERLRKLVPGISGGTSSRRAQPGVAYVPTAPTTDVAGGLGARDVEQIAGLMGMSIAVDTGGGGERRTTRRHAVFDYSHMNNGI